MEEKRVTIKEIAEKAGVSIGSVDRALQNRKGINPQTKAHILKTAEELGYKRNSFASALSRHKVFKIAAISSRAPVDFFRHIETGVLKAKHELKDYNIEVDFFTSPTLSPSAHIELLENLKFKEYDGIAINSISNISDTYINKFIDYGIPTITFNSDSSNSKRLFFVGNNENLSGRLAGELIGLFIDGEGEVAVVGNFLQTHTFIERFGGFSQIIAEDFPNILTKMSAECYSDEDRAYTIALEMLQQNPNIKALYSTNFSATTGIIKALKELNRKDIKMVGYDLNPSIISALKEGWCSAVIFQNPIQQGYQAIKMLAQYLLGEFCPAHSNYYTESRIVIKSNADYYTEQNLYPI